MANFDDAAVGPTPGPQGRRLGVASAGHFGRGGRVLWVVEKLEVIVVPVLLA